MYKSPIELVTRDIYSDILYNQENDIYKAIISYGINVDKEELIKALNYDRHQYDVGYIDGVMDFAEYLKRHSFLCDPDSGFSFNAIDIDDLDEFVNDFSRGK